MNINNWNHADFEHSRYFLRNEISRNKMRLKEHWQSYESIQISKKNIEDCSRELAMFSYVEVLINA